MTIKVSWSEPEHKSIIIKGVKGMDTWLELADRCIQAEVGDIIPAEGTLWFIPSNSPQPPPFTIYLDTTLPPK